MLATIAAQDDPLSPSRLTPLSFRACSPRLDLLRSVGRLFVLASLPAAPPARLLPADLVLLSLSGLVLFSVRQDRLKRQRAVDKMQLAKVEREKQQEMEQVRGWTGGWVQRGWAIFVGT